MNKTDQLIAALKERFQLTYSSSNIDPSRAEALVLGYFKGFLGVLEHSDDKLRAALDFHLRDTLEYNTKQSRLEEAA